MTYEEAIRCPRCGKTGDARVVSANTRDRQVNCYCLDKTCPFYGRLWFLLVDNGSRVLYHTHTPFQETATHD